MEQGSHHRIVTLAALADDDTYRMQLAVLLEHINLREHAATRLLHQAISAAAHAVLAPLAHEGVTVVVGPEQVGLRNDLRTERPDVWVGHTTEVHTLEPARHAVRAIHRLLDPIAALTMHHGHLGTKEVHQLTLDCLRVRCSELAHSVDVAYGDGWPNDLFAAILPLVRDRRIAA